MTTVPWGATYSALGWYNDLGLTQTVEAQLERDEVGEAEREHAREVWRALQAWRQGLR